MRSDRKDRKPGALTGYINKITEKVTPKIYLSENRDREIERENEKARKRHREKEKARKRERERERRLR